MTEDLAIFIQRARESLRDEFLYPEALLELTDESIDKAELLELTKAISNSVLQAKSLFKTARLNSIRDFISDFSTCWYSLQTSADLWSKQYKAFVGLESGDLRWADTHYPNYHLMAISELFLTVEVIFFLTNEKIIHLEVKRIHPNENANNLAKTLLGMARHGKVPPREKRYFLSKFQNHEMPSRKAIDKKWAAIQEICLEFERYDWEQLIAGLQQEMKSLLGIKITKLDADISAQNSHVISSTADIKEILKGLSNNSDRCIVEAAFENRLEWLTQEELASAAGIDNSTVYRRKKYLIESGILKVGKNGRGLRFSL